MKKFLFAFIIMVIVFVSCAFSSEIKTKVVPTLGIDPNIEFLSSGPFFDKKYTHFRVILSAMEIYSVVFLEKVVPETEGQRGKVLWTKHLKFDEGNQFISPKDFIESFKWVSPTSFSFVNLKQKYIVEGLDKDNPILKEVGK